jgi:hypothetical protein
VLLAVTLASILSAASVSEVSTMGDPAPAVGWGIVLLSMTSFFLLATLLSSWSQPDAVALRVAGAPRWLAPLAVLLHVVGIACSSTLLGLLLRRWMMGGGAWGWDALLLASVMVLAGGGSIFPAWRLWRVDLAEEIRKR